MWYFFGSCLNYGWFISLVWVVMSSISGALPFHLTAIHNKGKVWLTGVEGSRETGKQKKKKRRKQKSGVGGIYDGMNVVIFSDLSLFEYCSPSCLFEAFPVSMTLYDGFSPGKVGEYNCFRRWNHNRLRFGSKVLRRGVFRSHRLMNSGTGLIRSY